MKIISSIFLFAAVALSHLCAGEPTLNPPAPERIAALLDFSGPVTLTRHIATADEMARELETVGIPLAAFSYSDPAHSSDSISVLVYSKGVFLDDRRAPFFADLAKLSTKPEEGFEKSGIFPAADGRSIYQFPFGFGPGGGAYGALMACHDSRYELVLIESSSSHHGENAKEFSNSASPKKDLKSIIEAVEKLIFP
jgi:hypothetical protein